MTSRKSKVCRSPAPSLLYDDLEPPPIKPKKKLTIHTISLSRNVALLSSTPRDLLRKKQHEENKKTKRLTFRKKKSAYEEIATSSSPIDAENKAVEVEEGSDSEESFVSIVENKEALGMENLVSVRKVTMNENQRTLKRAMHNNLRMLAQRNVDDYSDLVENKLRKKESELDLDFDDETKLIEKKKSGSLKEFSAGDGDGDEAESLKKEEVFRTRKSREKIKERKSKRRGKREKVTVEKFKAVIEAKYSMEMGIPSPRKRRSASEEKRIEKVVDFETEIDDVDVGKRKLDERRKKEKEGFSVKIRGKELTLDRKSVQNERLAVLLFDDV